jgi:DNA polymerase I
MAIYTSYYGSKIIQGQAVSISLYPPNGFNGLHLPLFAPNTGLLGWYKSSSKDAKAQARYLELFKALLDKRKPDIDHWLANNNDEKGSEDFTFLCYEKPGEFCHRHLVLDYLKDSCFPITIKGELSIDNFSNVSITKQECDQIWDDVENLEDSLPVEEVVRIDAEIALDNLKFEKMIEYTQEPVKRSNEAYNIRNLVKVDENNRIHINEDEIDLFKYFEEPIKPWKPSINLPEYSTLTQLNLDIETTGLDSKKCQVVLIGLMNEKGKSIIIDCLQDEKTGLIKFLEILRKKNADLLITFNGFSFDLPFLIERMSKYGLKHPFYVSDRLKTFTTAQIFGKPSQYQDIWVNTHPKNKTCVVDLYHQVLSWDFVARKLTKHSLKQSVLQMGLRKEARLELTYEEMMECVKSGDITQLKEYLVFDLEDTKLLADFLIPSIWYQRMFLPDWKLQSISTSGNGSKWNDVLKKQYLNKPLPTTEDRKQFQGGLTFAKTGLFLNVSKIDVASLYPSLMLTYGIDSIKDTDRRMLGILQYLKNRRIELKELAKTGNKEANLMQGAMKIMINSSYGALGTGGIEFNDYSAAALVTAHGRAVLKLMMRTIKANGGTIISADTDGAFYSTDDPTFELNKFIHKATQDAMPTGIILDYEVEAKALFVPPKSKKDKDCEDGLKKNYIIIFRDGKIKYKGRYAKRDVCKLQKEFQPKIVSLMVESKQKADEYYHQVLNDMITGKYPIEELTITRKIRKGEKSLVDLGVGKEGDQVSFYRGIDQEMLGKKGQVLKNKKEVWTSQGVVGWQYYISLVKEMYQEITNHS